MVEVKTVIDHIRGCGWRKPGGIYLVAKGIPRVCGKLPIPCEKCPCCGAGIKPTRGFQWIEIDPFLKGRKCRLEKSDGCGRGVDKLRCRMDMTFGERVGLLWIGTQHYESHVSWLRESFQQGVSRRIAQVPKGLKLGETWVFVGHRKAVWHECPSCHTIPPFDKCLTCKGIGQIPVPGIFHAFVPQEIQYVVRGDEDQDHLERIVERGMVPVKVLRDEEQPDLPLEKT